MPPIPHAASTTNLPPTTGATADPPNASRGEEMVNGEGFGAEMVSEDGSTTTIVETTADVTGPKRPLGLPSNHRSSSRFQKFLEVYAQCGSVKQAAETAGIHRKTHYLKLKEDEVYRAAFAEAEQAAAQSLEDLAVERVRDLTYDYQMHLALLKRFRPELYKDRAQNDTTVTVNLADRLEAARKRLNEGQE